MISIVIPLHHGGGKFKDDSELRFALRSIAANFAEDSYQVAIVGRRLPPWVRNVRFIHQRAKGLKTALKMAAEAFPAGFFWYYDDCCILRRITAEEMMVTPCSRGWSKPHTSWARRLDAIRQRLEAEGKKAWDYSRPHGPYWFDKGMVDESFRDWPGMDGKLPFESWILSKRDWPRRHSGYKQYYGAYKGPPGDQQQFLNYNNAGFTDELRAWLTERFPEPSPFEALESESEERKVKVEVHTLRFGQSWWLRACAPTLDDWCTKSGHNLHVWTEAEVDPSYPSAKFCEVDMLRKFLAGDAEWMIYVDADVFVHPTAPAHPDLDKAFGFLIRHDRPSKFSRHFPKWCARHFGGDPHRVAANWTYSNAGVWACDRLAAQQLLAKIAPPYLECVQEQHHWNWWLALARQSGMVVNQLPAAWNAWPAENEPAAFFHLCGRKKSLKWNSLVERGLIPKPEEKPEPIMQAFDLTPYEFTRYDGKMEMDDLHIQMLFLAAGIDTGTPAESKVAVEIGSFRGRSTAALVEALNRGMIGRLHVVEVKPTAELRRVIGMATDPTKITLHTRPYWELDLKAADLVFIDGDHKWPAVGDTLCAVTSGAKIIAMHDSQSYPAIPGTWGAKLAADMLRRIDGRQTFEDAAERKAMKTSRGFLVSAPATADLQSLHYYLSLVSL